MAYRNNNESINEYTLLEFLKQGGNYMQNPKFSDDEARRNSPNFKRYDGYSIDNRPEAFKGDKGRHYLHFPVPLGVNDTYVFFSYHARDRFEDFRDYKGGSIKPRTEVLQSVVNAFKDILTSDFLDYQKGPIVSSRKQCLFKSVDEAGLELDRVFEEDYRFIQESSRTPVRGNFVQVYQGKRNIADVQWQREMVYGLYFRKSSFGILFRRTQVFKDYAFVDDLFRQDEPETVEKIKDNDHFYVVTITPVRDVVGFQGVDGVFDVNQAVKSWVQEATGVMIKSGYGDLHTVNTGADDLIFFEGKLWCPTLDKVFVVDL